MVYWIGFAIWQIGLIGLLFIAKEDKQFWKWLLWLVVLIGTFCYCAGAEINSRERAHLLLSQEVNLGQVPVVGQKDFSAQIKLTYKNGKLESVILIPKTTEVLPATQEVEPKK
ncbi:MAG: hypothetical protein WA064_02845 [Candidatus Moraniibacteriota bacterium]